MDYCCSTLKGSTHLPKLSGGDGGLRNGDEGFLRGGKVRGSLNGSVWVNHLQKSFSFQKQASKITKPGVAFSVITSDNGKETLVETLAAPRFERRRVNPKNVAAIILGGGAGTQLFPLTSKTATPAQVLALENSKLMNLGSNDQTGCVGDAVKYAVICGGLRITTQKDKHFNGTVKLPHMWWKRNR